jgi:hypothetical protein
MSSNSIRATVGITWHEFKTHLVESKPELSADLKREQELV